MTVLADLNDIIVNVLHPFFRYNNLVLMDATYKTCRLMLPLFILAVKTNVGYSPVATFIVQTEDTASISEALSHIKHYLEEHSIEVKNFMIDCSQAEISAIENVFPGESNDVKLRRLPILNYVLNSSNWN